MPSTSKRHPPMHASFYSDHQYDTLASDLAAKRSRSALSIRDSPNAKAAAKTVGKRRREGASTSLSFVDNSSLPFSSSTSPHPDLYPQDFLSRSRMEREQLSAAKNGLPSLFVPAFDLADRRGKEGTGASPSLPHLFVHRSIEEGADDSPSFLGEEREGEGAVSRANALRSFVEGEEETEEEGGRRERGEGERERKERELSKKMAATRKGPSSPLRRPLKPSEVRALQDRLLQVRQTAKKEEIVTDLAKKNPENRTDFLFLNINNKKKKKREVKKERKKRI